MSISTRRHCAQMLFCLRYCLSYIGSGLSKECRYINERLSMALIKYRSLKNNLDLPVAKLYLRQQAGSNDVSPQRGLTYQLDNISSISIDSYLQSLGDAISLGSILTRRVEAGWDCHTEECSSIPPLGMQCTAHQALYGTIITREEFPTFSLSFSRYQPCDFLIPVPDPFLACSNSRRQKPLFNNFKSRFPSYFSLPYLLQ